MSARERKKITIGEDEPDTMDLSEFLPDMDEQPPKVSADAVKAVSEKSGFASREPKAAAPKASRRRKSPYTAQIGARVRPERKDQFQDIAARLDMTDAQALDEALALWIEQQGEAHG